MHVVYTIINQDTIRDQKSQGDLHQWEPCTKEELAPKRKAY
jgi:hypothetical protein